MFMCVVHLKAVNKLDLTWKQSFLIDILKKDQIAIFLKLPYINKQRQK